MSDDVREGKVDSSAGTIRRPRDNRGMIMRVRLQKEIPATGRYPFSGENLLLSAGALHH
jgi:hypothetical protein